MRVQPANVSFSINPDGLHIWSTRLPVVRANNRFTEQELTYTDFSETVTIDGRLHPCRVMYMDCGVVGMFLLVVCAPGEQYFINPLTSEHHRPLALGCIIPELVDGVMQWVVQQRLLRDEHGFPMFNNWEHGPQGGVAIHAVIAHLMIKYGFFPQLEGVIADM